MGGKIASSFMAYEQVGAVIMGSPIVNHWRQRLARSVALLFANRSSASRKLKAYSTPYDSLRSTMLCASTGKHVLSHRKICQMNQTKKMPKCWNLIQVNEAKHTIEHHRIEGLAF